MSFVAFYSFLSYALIAAVTPGPNNILALMPASRGTLRRRPCAATLLSARLIIGPGHTAAISP